jgi:hypothetical protein
LNVRFPAVDAWPIGIIADAANAKAFWVILYLLLWIQRRILCTPLHLF